MAARQLIRALKDRYPGVFVDMVRGAKYSLASRKGRRAWSQEGEDLVVARMTDKRDGFYVDIGAHHPYRLSNTYLLHRRGWSGINVDPLPEAIRLFDRHRPGDANLNVGVSRIGGSLDYFMFNEPSHNTLDPAVAEEVQRNWKDTRLLKVVRIRTVPLLEIFEQHVPPGRSIDLLNVDVEGMDLQVLSSNDWNRYRPAIVIAEIRHSSVDDVIGSELACFMRERGYTLFSKLYNSVIFRDQQT